MNHGNTKYSMKHICSVLVAALLPFDKGRPARRFGSLARRDELAGQIEKHCLVYVPISLRYPFL